MMRDPEYHHSSPNWDLLYGTAASQAGYFTTAQAAEAGYSRPLLHKHQQNGRIERVGWGIYRLIHFPPSELEEFVQVWLRFDHQAVFSHETALSMHQLSDVLPAKIHLTLPRNWRQRRLKQADNQRLYYSDLPDRDISWIEVVPVTTPARTVCDCAEVRVQPELVNQAVEQGLRRGLFEKLDIVPAFRYLDGFQLRKSW